MKRKIVAQGNQSITLTLPISWVREQQLKAGDEVEVTQQGGELIISKQGGKKGGTYKIAITAQTNNSKLLRSLIFGAYRSGADEIEISFETLEVMDREIGKIKTVKYIQDTVNLLIGISIIEQTKNYCKIKDITGASEEEFDTILRRTFLIILSIAEQSLKAFEEKDQEALQDVPLIYNSLVKFTEYSMRLLSKYEHKEHENTSHYYSIITCFDDISEAYRHFTKHFAAAHSNPSVLKAFQDLNTFLRTAYEWFYKPNDQKLTSQLFQHRDISYQSIYSAETQKTKHMQNSGVLEAIQSIRAIITCIIRERMAMMKEF